MAIEAPLSKFKKNSLKIWIVVCIFLAGYCAYDGYYNKSFIEKHTPDQVGGNGKADSTLIFNRKSPPFFLAGAVILGVYLYLIQGRKIIADENELIIIAGLPYGPDWIRGKKKIPYDSIREINKTFFEKRGFFTITYISRKGFEGGPPSTRGQDARDTGSSTREIGESAISRVKLNEKNYDNLKAVLDHLVAKIT